MAKIIPDDIRDISGEDTREKIETIYQYIQYMKERLDFWASLHERQTQEYMARIDAQLDIIQSDVEDLRE